MAHFVINLCFPMVEGLWPFGKRLVTHSLAAAVVILFFVLYYYTRVLLSLMQGFPWWGPGPISPHSIPISPLLAWHDIHTAHSLILSLRWPNQSIALLRKVLVFFRSIINTSLHAQYPAPWEKVPSLPRIMFGQSVPLLFVVGRFPKTSSQSPCDELV